ncbi:unnamed protein product [Tilletia controversa]|uniref:Uncharacterized protein n=1 Tax=Tilletia controversa TaxID=13291 RepID=A0A8X7MUV9_9BASI|nr:hypothetical protein A4X06_0g3272 [Tilletia controversa]CAD6896824.1 unnamed protein product [Tilletia controversa]CAD6971788.1 unnamed protein product [Tilletia controversa]CAD6979251.1 unnamed protein product [Tilletia controversa]
MSNSIQNISPPSSPSSLSDLLSSQPFFNPEPPASGGSTESDGDNAGFPHDQAAEDDADPNEEEAAGTDPESGDDVGAEEASSDGEDDGADLVGWIVGPEEVVQDEASSVGEESAQSTQGTSSSDEAGDADAEQQLAEMDPGGAYVPPGEDAGNGEDIDQPSSQASTASTATTATVGDVGVDEDDAVDEDDEDDGVDEDDEGDADEDNEGNEEEPAQAEGAGLDVVAGAAHDDGFAAYDAEYDAIFAAIADDGHEPGPAAASLLPASPLPFAFPPAPSSSPLSGESGDFKVVGIKRAACFVKGTTSTHSNVYPLWKKSKPSP